MAYTVVTEAQADAREWVQDGLLAVQAALVANAATLKSGSRAVASGSIQIGTISAMPKFPAISVDVLDVREAQLSMGSGGERMMTMTFRVVVYDLQTGAAATLVQNVAQLADRVRAALVYNDTLDGGVFNLEIGRAVFGRIPAGGSFIVAAQIDVVAQKNVSRP